MAQANRSLSLNRDLYHDVTARILAELERGALPWIKPWSATAGANVPANAVTNRPYSGCTASPFDKSLKFAQSFPRASGGPDRRWPFPVPLTLKLIFDSNVK
jgi:antirestriction protein ArdC